MNLCFNKIIIMIDPKELKEVLKEHLSVEAHVSIRNEIVIGILFDNEVICKYGEY